MQVETLKEPQTLSASNLESLKVLLVDDEPSIIETLQLFLKNLGILCIHNADCGETALEYINKHTYHYIFVDLMMPGMSGIDLLKRVQQYQQLTSVIIITGYPSMDVVIDAMHNGASDFLVKPFRFEDIKIILERIQKLHQLREKNWQLHRALKEKKKVEELNNLLEKKIRLQSLLFNIANALSEMSRPEDIYRFLVDKAVESCNAKKACFMIYDQEDAKLLLLAQKGLEVAPGIKAGVNNASNGKRIMDGNFIQSYFGRPFGNEVPLDRIYKYNGLITVPFNIRNEPFGVLLVSEKEDDVFFDKEDEFLLHFLSKKAALNIENMALYDNLKESLFASFLSLVSAIEAKDTYTQQHSSRVTEFSLKIAYKMGCPQDDIKRLELAGPLHDIGKIGVKDSILNKPDKLTDDEFAHIKNHPLIGVNIVSPLGLDPSELAIIRNHHERWDGKGYPDGLARENIPKVSRILAVADAFDAMSSSRAYRKALPFSMCIKELKGNSGTQFDPEVVRAALSLLNDSWHPSS